MLSKIATSRAEANVKPLSNLSVVYNDNINFFLFAGCCAYIDAENAMNPSLAEAMGVDIENLLITHPTSAENSLSIVNTLITSGSVDVIVVDSVCAL